MLDKYYKQGDKLTNVINYNLQASSNFFLILKTSLKVYRLLDLAKRFS